MGQGIEMYANGYPPPYVGERDKGEPIAAAQLWEAFVKAHVPGLKFADMPRFILVPFLRYGKDPAEHVARLDGMETHPDGWERATKEVRKWFTGDVVQVPKGWTFAKIANGYALPTEHDEPNPRVYNLKGHQVRQAWESALGWNPSEVLRTFEARLCILFTEAPMNTRSDLVRYRLQYHHNQGGNPAAFRGYVASLADTWTSAPPLYNKPPAWAADAGLLLPSPPAKPMRNASQLVALLRAWLAEVEATPRKSKPTPPPLRPLAERFPSPKQYDRFIQLLKEQGIIDAGGVFIPGQGRKGRLFGAYLGASENKALSFSTGADAEAVATLNDAFPTLGISDARPQDMHGTPGFNTARRLFSSASFPQ